MLAAALVFSMLQAVTVTHASQVPAGHPVRVELDSPGHGCATVQGVAEVKCEWQAPKLVVYFKSTGAASYRIETRDAQGAVNEPAMVGAGDRVTYGAAGIRGRLAVGLYAHTAVIDIDRDGAPDLVLSSPDRPYNGIYYFHNIGSREKPFFARGVWWGPAKNDLLAADFDGDGRPDLVYRGGYFSDPATNRLTKPVDVKLPRGYHVGRDDFFFPVDWDGDGRIDVLNGPSDWRDYGWDDAFDETGAWRRGPLHGPVYFFRNRGTNQAPVYDPPVQLQAAGADIDRYGSPTPQAFDWFKRGMLDLFTGSFVDTVALYRATAKGVLGRGDTLPYRAELCMIQPRVTSAFHADGRPELVIGEEGGAVTYLENLAPYGSEPHWAEPRYFEQQDPLLKSASLSRPVAVDWDGDGDLDLIAGNSAGYLQWFENTGTRTAPRFADRGYLRAQGKPIRRVAGGNGSVQGPAEAKWGYSNPSVADWDLDGKLDILVNDIWGHVVWYRGTANRMELEPARDVEVEWKSAAPPKPDWVWWNPKPKQLVTQWRTTPRVVDWDRDGLPDLVMLNHQGYLSLFRRARCANGKLCLGEPERIFTDASNGRFLYLSKGRAGASGRRKIELVDWDGDGDLDLLTDSDDGPVWYENVGSQAKPAMAFRGTVVEAKLAGHNPTPNAADWNGDGKLDLLVGAEDGFFYFFDRNYIDSLARKK